MKRYRVIQWATGLAGKESIKQIVKHPSLELVGVKVYSPDKVGVDAGTICGIDPVAVSGMDSEKEILALDADCILWMGQAAYPWETGVPELCRMLESGKNVITIVHAPFGHPASLSPELRDPVEAACARGNSSLHVTGIHPGFLVEGIVAAMTGACRQVDRILFREILNFDFFDTPYIPVDLCGFGADKARQEAFLSALLPYQECVHYLGQAMGVTVEKIDLTWDINMAERDWETGFGIIRKGTTAALRFKNVGYVGGQPRIILESIWRTNPSQVPEWPQGETYQLSIEGRPPWNVSLDIPCKETMDTTAYIAVNSVPAVCEARPGIVTKLDLPVVTGLGVFAD